MVHQEGHLAGKVAAADAVHIPQVRAVHADQQVVLVVVLVCELARRVAVAGDPMLRQLAPCRRIDRVADLLPAGSRRLDKREYFFPGPSGNIISASSIPFNFRKIWLAAGLKRDGEIKPRPYDFRHHFACANIARWAKERKDVISMLPYLMRYMGHSSLEKTYYYVHLIPDYFADYAAATENLESLLPEVEPYEI